MLILLNFIFWYFLGVVLFFMISVIHTYYFKENIKYITNKKERLKKSQEYIDYKFGWTPWVLSWFIFIVFLISLLFKSLKFMTYKLLEFIMIR